MTLRMVSLLAEPQHSGYRELCQVMSREGYPMEFLEVEDWSEAQRMLEYGQVDLASVCGLLYLLLRAKGVPLKPIASPLLTDKRHAEGPTYWADVVVAKDSKIQDFTQLEGGHWLFNEEGSLSGYRAFMAELSARGHRQKFLGETTATGSHASSLEALLGGKGDFTVLDSTFLASLPPGTQQKIRTVKSLGPAPAPLLVSHGHADTQKFMEAWAKLQSSVGPFQDFVPVGAHEYRAVADIWNQSCLAEEHRHNQVFLSPNDNDGQAEFTQFSQRKADHDILAQVAQGLPEKLGTTPTKTHSNGVDFFLSQRGELQRHTYLIQPQKLTSGSLAVVGFLSLMKEDGDLAALFEADDRLLAEFHKYEGFLSYSPTEYAPGRWANLAVFENLQARETWAANSIHLNAIKDLGADSYRNVRLHLGVWESLERPISWLATRYLDYAESGLQRSVFLAD